MSLALGVDQVWQRVWRPGRSLGDLRMRRRIWTIAGWAALMFAGSLWAELPGDEVQSSSAAGEISSVSPAGGEVLRKIVDPATGNLWLLERDPERPSGPGRLVLVRHGEGVTGCNACAVNTPSRIAAQPVVRAGDLLVIEEHTSFVDARFTAVALESALKGAPLRARLRVGGFIVVVVAESPGHAVLDGRE